MKLLILKKKYLYILCILFLILFLLSTILFKPFSLAVELTTTSLLQDTTKEKFASILKSDDKIAYLTFDDGPTQKATPKVLQILKEENVKATFFVVGKHVKENPELVKQAYDDGHYIANHGYTHNNSNLYKSTDNFIEEVKNTDAEIGNALGIPNYCSHIFRFPNGYMSKTHTQKKKEYAKILSDMNYVYIDWNCLNNDSLKKYSPYQLVNNLKKSSKNKGTLIILMHDTCDVNNTPSILKDSISYLKQQGYEFRNFYDLL